MKINSQLKTILAKLEKDRKMWDEIWENSRKIREMISKKTAIYETRKTEKKLCGI
jgi:hypothetical protein